MTRFLASGVLLVGLCGVALAQTAATPPSIMNFQGVLRDASTGGVELLRNERTAAQSCRVQVSVGQYVVRLGECTITGGLPYNSLATLFREKSVVYLELKVATDPPMVPRIRVVSAAYSLNTDNLDGRDSSYFTDTSSTVQTKGGPLYLAGGNSDLSGSHN